VGCPSKIRWSQPKPILESSKPSSSRVYQLCQESPQITAFCAHQDYFSVTYCLGSSIQFLGGGGEDLKQIQNIRADAQAVLPPSNPVH
jgi:hypothetical protein